MANPPHDDLLNQVKARLNGPTKVKLGITVFTTVGVSGPVSYISVAPVNSKPDVDDLADLLSELAGACKGLGEVVPAALRWDNANLYLGRLTIANVVVVCLFPRLGLASRYMGQSPVPPMRVPRAEIPDLRFT